MRKRIRVVLASVCAFALVGAFALAGCSSNTEQQAGETQKPAEEQAKSESHEAVELQLFARTRCRRPWTLYRSCTRRIIPG